jgi:hypothetical protein
MHTRSPLVGASRMRGAGRCGRTLRVRPDRRERRHEPAAGRRARRAGAMDGARLSLSLPLSPRHVQQPPPGGGFAYAWSRAVWTNAPGSTNSPGATACGRHPGTGRAIPCLAATRTTGPARRGPPVRPDARRTGRVTGGHGGHDCAAGRRAYSIRRHRHGRRTRARDRGRGDAAFVT